MDAAVATRGTVFEDCTFNVQPAGAFQVNLSTITNVVTFRGTTTAMSADFSVVDFLTGGNALLVRLEGVIEGNNRLELDTAGNVDDFNFTASLSVNSDKPSNLRRLAFRYKLSLVILSKQ